ncbi:MAG: VOC family protein, partial [Cellvibrionaceae bacterium]|nr:VOC family protein [Cellvibrionaceae bacterium]
MFDSLDHLIIVVANLEQACADYECLLGRKASWHGQNPKAGISNTIFRLENTYLELVVPTGGSQFSQVLKAHLDAHGPGIFGMALATANLDLCRQKLAAKGVMLGPIMDGEASSPESERRHWRMAVLPAEHSRGLFTLVVEHRDPLALPLARAEAGHDGRSLVHRLDHFVINSNDGDDFKRCFSDGLGLSLRLDQSREEWGMRQLFYRLGANIMEVIVSLDPDKMPANDYFWGLAYTVPDPEHLG